jgi:hypothetical protein
VPQGFRQNAFHSWRIGNVSGVANFHLACVMERALSQQSAALG